MGNSHWKKKNNHITFTGAFYIVHLLRRNIVAFIDNSNIHTISHFTYGPIVQPLTVHTQSIDLIFFVSFHHDHVSHIAANAYRFIHQTQFDSKYILKHNKLFINGQWASCRLLSKMYIVYRFGVRKNHKMKLFDYGEPLWIHCAWCQWTFVGCEIFV